MASEITKLYKESGGQYVPISPEISLDELSIGQEIADLWNKKSTPKVEATTSLKEYLEVLTDVATTTVSGTSGSYVIGATTQYTTIDTEGEPDAKTKWNSTYKQPTEALRYAWKREATLYQNPDLKAKYPNGFYIDASGNYIDYKLTAQIPWVYSFCGSLGQTGGAGESVTYTVYLSFPTTQVPTIVSDRSAENWGEPNYAPGEWTYTQPLPKANYSIWKSTRAWLNKNDWTDFTNPVRIYTGETTGSSGRLVVDPNNCTLTLSLNSAQEVYYKIDFIKMLLKKIPLVFTFKKPLVGDLTIVFPKYYMPSKSYEKEDIVVKDNNGNTLEEGTDYEMDLKDCDLSDISWVNCVNAVVHVYNDKDQSNEVSTISITRSGMEGYYTQTTNEGELTIISTEETTNTIKNTAEENSQIISGMSANLCYGGACTEEICNKSILVGNTKYPYLFLNSNSISKTTELGTGSYISITNEWISFYLPALQKGKYTISCWIKTKGNGKLYALLSTGYNITYPTSAISNTLWDDAKELTNFTQVSVTVDVSKGTNALFLKGTNVIVGQVQVEVGSNTTNWHEAGNGIYTEFIQQFDTIEQSVTNIENNSKSYLRVDDGHVKAYVEDEECKTGLDISKDGSTFTGKVSATNFEITKLTDKVTDINLNTTDGVVWFTTGAVCKNISTLLTPVKSIEDNDPVILIKSNNKFYYVNLVQYFSEDSGYTPSDIGFYKVEDLQSGGSVLKEVDVLIQKTSEDKAYVDAKTLQPIAGYYWIAEQSSVGFAVTAHSDLACYFIDSESILGPLYLEGTLYAQYWFENGKKTTAASYMICAYYPEYYGYEFTSASGEKRIEWRNVLEDTPSYFYGSCTTAETTTYASNGSLEFWKTTSENIQYKEPLRDKEVKTKYLVENRSKGTPMWGLSITYYDIANKKWETLNGTTPTNL